MFYIKKRNLLYLSFFLLILGWNDLEVSSWDSLERVH